jgi:hypothetical protein
MRRDWVLGFGAFSTLMVLMGIDSTLSLVAYKGQKARTAILRSLGVPRGR